MSFIDYTHTVDIYHQSLIVNFAGQEGSTWTLASAGVKTIYLPMFTENRIDPAFQELGRINFYLKGSVQLNNSDRFKDFKDKRGNIIDPSTYEILAIKRHPGFSGNIRHLHIIARLVEQL